MSGVGGAGGRDIRAVVASSLARESPLPAWRGPPPVSDVTDPVVSGLRAALCAQPIQHGIRFLNRAQDQMPLHAPSRLTRAERENANHPIRRAPITFQSANEKISAICRTH